MNRLRATILISTFVVIPFSVSLAQDAVPEVSPPESPASVRTITLMLRDGPETIWQGEVSIPDSDTATTSITASDGTSANVLAASALAALMSADASASEFSVSNLQYFASYGSFYTKCITAATEKCDNWQYVVGDLYPSISMDQFVLHDGDRLFVYFGSPRRVTLSTTSIPVNESFTATAQQYVPASDSYAKATGVTISITVPNPDDSYSPFIIASSLVDMTGAAFFSVATTGTYAVGIAEDYYYPSSMIFVIESAVETEEIPPPPAPSGGGRSAPAHSEMNVPAALFFLAQHQRADGSFETPLLTDWAAFAFAATPEYESGESLLRAYLTDDSANFSSVTDHERRAMALMALNVDPRTGTAVDHIAKILSYFDGIQFGSTAQVNDDIFALIPLLRAGYGPNDEEVADVLAFLIEKQRNDGSWDGSIDLTAAGIQALAPLGSLPGAAEALRMADAYLRAQQSADGGFGNSFSTSWVTQAIVAEHGTMDAWQPAGKNPKDYLASRQSSDGGLEIPSTEARTRIWATEYAIPAALGEDWRSLMHQFEKPLLPTRITADIPELTSIPIRSISPMTSETPTVDLATPVMNDVPTVAAKIVPTSRVVDAPESETHQVDVPIASTTPALYVAAAASAVDPPTSSIFASMWEWFVRLGAAIRSVF